MFDLDQEAWIYLTLIIAFLAFFLWNSGRTKKLNKQRKNKNFRKRYLERKRENGSDSL